MGRRTIRLGSTISFDKEKEADIIKKVEFLKGRHMLGDFISNLLRVTLDSPDKLESKEKLNKSLDEIASCGMLQDRYKFFNDVSKSIEELKSKVDAMHDMNVKLLCLAQFGKHMGLESKTNNLLMAQFVLEQQLNEISNKLGITHANHVFNSNKLQDTKEKAGEVFLYIIETYDSIVKEMQENLFKQIEVNVSAVGVAPVAVAEPVKEKETTKATVAPVVLFDDSTTENEEPIDFGQADLGALDAFLG